MVLAIVFHLFLFSTSLLAICACLVFRLVLAHSCWSLRWLVTFPATSAPGACTAIANCNVFSFYSTLVAHEKNKCNKDPSRHTKLGLLDGSDQFLVLLADLLDVVQDLGQVRRGLLCCELVNLVLKVTRGVFERAGLLDNRRQLAAGLCKAVDT